jgi:hypothetical protein
MLDSKSIMAALGSVTRDWTRQARAEERDHNARLRREQALTRQARMRKVTLKDAVFWEMENAIAYASGRGRTDFPKRNLYYAVRKRIQEHTDETLTSKYFENLLDQWASENGEVAGMYCDPRGYFVEPHSGKVVPLGTKQIEAYSIPAWSFHTLIYAEKKGMHGLFKMAQIAERYDAGIICAEGYAVDAAKMLLTRAGLETTKMRVLVLHDADPWGYNICRILQKELGDDVEVIDIGLSLADAIEMDLPLEEFVRDRRLPQELVLNDLETEHFEGEPIGWRNGRAAYKCQRVELNALAADPDRFIAYVEEQLKKHGCAEKLVPPTKVLLQSASDKRASLLGDVIRDTLAEVLNEDEIVEQLTKRFAKQVTIKDLPNVLATWAARLEPESWENELSKQLRDRVDLLADDLDDAVLVRIREIAKGL